MKPVEYVEPIPGITQRERELILRENPARLLKLCSSVVRMVHRILIASC